MLIEEKAHLWELISALLAACVLGFSPLSLADELKREDIAVTAYNVDRAVIRDTRSVELEKGVNWVKFSDVAALIIPTSVHLTSSTDKAFEIEEQNFDYDLVSDAKLLSKYIGEYVAVADKDGHLYEGILLVGSKATIDRKGKITHHYNNLVIEHKDGRLLILPKENIADISFPLLPQGLITRPTLYWKIYAGDEGPRPCEIAYMTRGMNWHADYVLLLKEEGRRLDLSGMVTLDNQTGATYENARLKLVAGDVHMVEEEVALEEEMELMSRGQGRMAGALPQFEEKEFFEYHLYTLQRRATLKDNQTKQIDFVNARNIKAERIYVYDGARFSQAYSSQDPAYGTLCNKKVDVYLEFKNSEENNLGIPLPRGKIRIKEEDAQGKESFIGEDEIDHTPRDEKILLKVGETYDLVGERKQVDFKRPGPRMADEEFEIALRNHKDEDVEIRIVEHLYRWADWEVIENSHPFIKTDSRTIEFRVKVPQDEEIKISYRVRYRW